VYLLRYNRKGAIRALRAACVGLLTPSLSGCIDRRVRDQSRSETFSLCSVPEAIKSNATMQRHILLGYLSIILLCLSCSSTTPKMNSDFSTYTLDYSTRVDPSLQTSLEEIDANLRAKYSMTEAETAVGLLDLNTTRLAMIHPDREDYAASIPKIGILLAYFQLNPQAATNLDAQVRHELGLMVKISSNEMAAKYSRLLGLKEIQGVLNSYGFYDANRGGGIWVGKHYGQGGERYGDPVGDNSHAATVRQLLRYFVLLEQGKLVSPAASATMRQIFESPAIPHEINKFLKGLKGRNLEIIRKSGTWENWMHDAAVISGGRRHYVLVALTRHPKGDTYLADLAQRVDDLMISITKP